jgi:hypothetical protein
MRVVLFTLIALACTAAGAAGVYRWVDANGVVHYSDQPQQGAAKVEVAPPQTYHAPAVPGDTASDQPSPDAATPSASSCYLLMPTQDQVFMNTTSVSGRIQLSVPLNPGDRLSVVLDGTQREVGGDGSGGFTVSGVERGTHTLMALVQTQDGQQRCQTQTVIFHVRQPSVQAPTSPVHPH